MTHFLTILFYALFTFLGMFALKLFKKYTKTNFKIVDVASFVLTFTFITLILLSSMFYIGLSVNFLVGLII